MKDLFDWAQEALEGVALDGHHAAVSLGLDACLSHCVLDQSDLSEVVTFFVLEDLLHWSSGRFLLLSNQLSLSDDVETVALVSLLDHIRSSLEFLLLETVAELFLLVGINFSQDLNLREDLGVILPFFGGRFLDDVVEGGPIEPEELACSLALDGCGSWRIVHEGKLSKELPRFVGLEVGLLAIDDLEAVKVSLIDDVKGISLLPLSNDSLAGLSGNFFHGIDDNAQIFLIERLEEYGLLDELADLFFGGGVLWNDLLGIFCLLVELPKHLSTDALSTVFLFHLLLLFLFQFSQKFSLHLLGLLIRIRVNIFR